MTSFYVRTTGNDALAGTSPATAWATFGKALGASGIASGDTLYVGGGTYRENAVVQMTSAVAETKIIGDVSGFFTGDPGLVRLSGFSTDDRTTMGGKALSLNSRDFLTFQDIVFEGGVSHIGLTSTNITYTRCTFYSMNAVGASASYDLRLDGPAALLFDSCIFFCAGGAALLINLDLNASADYNCGVVLKNCLMMAFTTQHCVRINQTSGSGTFKGGGVAAYNCTMFAGATSFGVISSNISTTIPCLIYNCILCAGTNGISATTLGQITEDYNDSHGPSPNSNVTAGTHSRTSVSGTPPWSILLEVGQSQLAGLRPRFWFTPADLSPMLGYGNQAGGPSVDLLRQNRPSGGCRVVDSGTATGAASGNTLPDSTKSWAVNAWRGYTVRITGGTGAGQYKHISANTANGLTVSGNWATALDVTSTYDIFDGCASTGGKATSTSSTTLADSGAAWGSDRWKGATLELMSGAGAGQTRTVLSHTGTTLTVAAWTTTPAAGDVYRVYFGSQSVVQPGIGCLERGNTGERETVVVDSGSNALSAEGCWVHEFVQAVDAVATTIGIKSQFDSNYGAGTKPQLSVLGGAAVGVADATSTSTQTAGAWYSHSLSFTPTAKGFVTIRLVASGAVDSKTAFDTYSKTP